MRFLHFIVSAVFLYSCTDANTFKTAVEEKSYEEIVNDHLASYTTPSKTFLQFELGSPIRIVNKQIDSLIKMGKLGEESSLEYARLGLKLTGNQYNLQLNDSTSIDVLVGFNMFKDSLYKISLKPYGDYQRDSIKEFMIKQYGKPTYVEVEENLGNVFYWLKNGHEISFVDDTWTFIEFTDIKIKRLIKQQQLEVDSLKAELNKINASETKKDFQ